MEKFVNEKEEWNFIPAEVFSISCNRPGRENCHMKYSACFNGEPRIVDVTDICYFESYDRKTSVVTEHVEFRVRTKLTEEEQKLPDSLFVRISQWNIVNMSQIGSLVGNELRMRNGALLSITRGYWKEFLKRYENYVRENYTILQNPQ